jgi:hypothetical protein
MSAEANCTEDVLCVCNTDLCNSAAACNSDLCNQPAPTSTPTNYASGKVSMNMFLGLAAMAVAMLIV